MKSPSRLALMREGVLDLGMTVREWAIPHAVVFKVSEVVGADKKGDERSLPRATWAPVLLYFLPI